MSKVKKCGNSTCEDWGGANVGCRNKSEGSCGRQNGKGGELVKASAEVDDGMLAIIREDVRISHVGMFSALRAGFGLNIMKGFCPHGEWEIRMAEVFPNANPRTLQRYMANATGFCELYGCTAQFAWNEFKGITREQMETLSIAPPAEVKQLAGGKAKAKGAESASGGFMQNLLDFMSQKKSEKKKVAEPAKPQTKKEKIETAIADAVRILNEVDGWIGKAGWPLADSDTLDGVAAALRAAADKLRAEIRRRLN